MSIILPKVFTLPAMLASHSKAFKGIKAPLIIKRILLKRIDQVAIGLCFENDRDGASFPNHSHRHTNANQRQYWFAFDNYLKIALTDDTAMTMMMSRVVL